MGYFYMRRKSQAICQQVIFSKTQSLGHDITTEKTLFFLLCMFYL